MLKLIGTFCLLTLLCFAPFYSSAQSKKKGSSFHIISIFPQKKSTRPTSRCPNYESNKRKVGFFRNKNIETYEEKTKPPKTAKLVVKSKILEFDIIEIGEKRLEIPEFKQFKNNRSDFTEQGYAQFNKIVSQIKEYLGENKSGKGLTLRIKGSASQIPTSFHPKKPNFGINSDGSSIKGQTNIENNIYLAHARATELERKIKEVFPRIQIITPKLDEITLGETAWTPKVQRALDKAHLAGDKKGMQKVFEPFQKEQFVSVESKDKFIQTIRPSSIKTYSLAAVPRLKTIHEGNEIEIKGQLIISEGTYKLLKHSHLKFEDVAEREVFMKKHKLKTLLVEGRWHIVSNREEEKVLSIADKNRRIKELYTIKMNAEQDYKHISKIVKEDYLRNNNFEYILKSNKDLSFITY